MRDELAGFRFVRDRIVGSFEDASMEEKTFYAHTM